MIGYKGFDKNFKCRDFQFEVGKTYHHDGEIKICERGFHFCDTPLAVFNSYPPVDSRFALVEANGSLAQDKDDKHKFCTNELTILKELTLGELISASNTGYYSAATNTGYCSAATNTGDYSAATNTGYRSAATNTGDYSAASVAGKHSVALVTGANSKAKGTLGCWIVLSEWANGTLVEVKAFKVDGQHIKPDTFYSLIEGQAVEILERD